MRGKVRVDGLATSKAIDNTYFIPMLDLYSIVEDKPELYSPDGVHLTGEGYKMLAEAVYDLTKEIVK